MVVTADVLSLLLDGEGCRVRTVGAGRRARAEVERRRPDLVNTDIMHPDLDGITLARQFRELGIPVILTSAGRGDPQPAGVPFLAKPFDIDHLLAVVAEVRSIGKR